MSQVYIVVDDPKGWEPYYPSDRIITFQDYLSLEVQTQQRVRVINLCQDYSYLREGYYCSLFAEARDHHVIPSMRVLNDISHPLLYKLQLGQLAPTLEKALKGRAGESEIIIKSYFGVVSDSNFKTLARILFERFPCPVLSFTLTYTERWEITEIGIVNHRLLDDEEQTEFANALDNFSSKVWRQHKQKKTAKYDLAILVNDDEKFPPSDSTALKKFISAGKALDIDVELISPSDFVRLSEFDALFIRETTAIDHHTYRFAKKAEAEGMVVIDDPTSILRCTNKIFLAKLFETHKVPTPRTIILQQGETQQLQQAVEQLGFPLVLKIPDGSFSRGIVKVESFEALAAQSKELFKRSSLLLVQEYLYTDFDWRIGVLNNKPLYACRYYMVKNHWQIYRHNDNKSADSGGFDTMPTFEVPKAVLQAALKATKPIGNGLYGVDVKESAGKGYVIEVNDNPSLESGVEDKYMGNELYSMIMKEFVSRIEAKRNS
ncbi:MAG: RimK family protein [Spongiibacteraceae bacterium]